MLHRRADSGTAHSRYRHGALFCAWRHAYFLWRLGLPRFQKPSRVQFTVYPIADGTFQSRYFDDDGHTYAYRDGHCVDAVFTVACAADTVTVQVENRGDTPFAPHIRLTPADHRQLIIK